MKLKIVIIFAIVFTTVPIASFVISPGIIQNPNYRWNIGLSNIAIGPFYVSKYLLRSTNADLRRIYKSIGLRFYKHIQSEQNQLKIEETKKDILNWTKI